MPVAETDRPLVPGVAVTTRSAAEAPPVPVGAPLISTRRLNAWFGSARVVRNVTIDFADRAVTAVIGPSGCGKSTLLRCLNRLHETIPGAIVEGDVLLGGESIYRGDLNAIAVRRHIGMVFQRPTPFPTMSIRDNVAAGLRIQVGSGPSRKETDEIVQGALERAGLWTEVKDRLRDSAIALSGGQQQRICIARALATRPRVILLDEPTASLDPLSTQRIEELVYELRQTIAVVIVTHNMQQAARVSDITAFMLNGELVEVAPTTALFTTPADSRTEAYVTGRFG
ncbi:MAG: phosphate ABC transporter ATP-binding protein [Gemmatimonadaceae bacterium]|nr:phosphate ABC transporter ATP-binding protein [Gemmatimonadaceae bacterium]